MCGRRNSQELNTINRPLDNHDVVTFNCMLEHIENGYRAFLDERRLEWVRLKLDTSFRSTEVVA